MSNEDETIKRFQSFYVRSVEYIVSTFSESIIRIIIRYLGKCEQDSLKWPLV